MYISGRERKILEHLLDVEVYVTVKNIANALQVSTRTIHRDLASIEAILFDHQLELKKKAGKGLRIDGEKMDKQQLKSALIQAGPINEFTSEERQAIVLLTLLEMKEPVKLFALANELKVTVATISNDLDEIIEDLTSYDLSLVRRRGYGIRIEGNEADKRALLSHFITKYVDIFNFVSLIKENIQTKSKHQIDAISNRLLGLVNREKLRLIERSLLKVRQDLPYELADNSYIGLVVHLAIAIERIQQGDKIEFDQTYIEQIKETKEYHIAKKISQDLSTSLNLTIPVDEIGYITMHLMGAKLRIDQNYLIEESSLDIAYKAKELIQYVGSQFQTDLTTNATLLNDLVAHLKPTIYRLQQGMNIYNPMLKEIQNDYQDLFLIVQEGVRDTLPDIIFPDEEIGFLVLHFAATLLHDGKDISVHALVICASGIGTAKILAMKLMQQIPEIKQVANKSLFDLEQIDPDAYDIIVSTIPLNGFDHNYILASPMLTEADIRQINKVVKQKKLSCKHQIAIDKKPDLEDDASTDIIQRLQSVKNYTDAMLDLLSYFRVMTITEKQTINKLLFSMCTQLEEEKILINKKNVIKKLLEREQISGMGIPNTTLALYHTRSDDVLKPSFTICSLDYSMTVQGMDGENMVIDTMLLMLAPEQAKQELLEVLSYLSGIIIQSQTSLKLFASGNEENIKQFLFKQFNQFSNEKKLL